MSNKLDQFFKRKLQDRQFDFDESYWNEMEQMLPQKKHSRKTFWMWLGLVALLGSLLSSIWLLPQSKKDNPVNNNPNIAQKISSKIEHNPTSTALKPNPDVKTQRINGNQSKPIQSSQPKAHSINNRISPTKTKHLATTTRKADPKTIPSGTPPFHWSSLPTPKDDQNEGEIQAKQKQDTNNSQNKWATSIATTKVIQHRAATYTTEQLDNIAPNLLNSATPFPSVANIRPMKHRRWQYSIITERQMEANHPKWKAGVSLHYQVSPYLSLASEVKYAFQTGTFRNVLMHSDSTFSFGYIQEDVQIQPKSLHFVDIPIYASLDLGQQSILGGFEFQKLLGVKGDIATYQTGQLQPNNRTLSHTKTGWLPTDSFSPLNTYFLLGYEYRLGRMAIGVRSQYHLSRLSIRADQTERFVTNPNKATWSLTFEMPLSGKNKPIKR